MIGPSTDVFVSSLVEWSYETMQKWSRDNRYCAGHLQSPIDLPFNISHHDRRLRTLVFEDRHTTGRFSSVERGHDQTRYFFPS